MNLKSYLAWPGAPLAIGSAALFGASTPLAKGLLGGGISPWLLAGLLYLGSGFGLTVVYFGRSLVGCPSREASLSRKDIGWMVLVVLSGGVVGPVLLMIGLTTTAASTAALLLNLEGLATMAIAWLVFRENVDRRLLLGALAILAGALLLSWQPGQGLAGLGLGSLAIAGACLAWGIDNNLTRKVSGSDPVEVAMIKGIAAGGVTGAGPVPWRALALNPADAGRWRGRLLWLRRQPGDVRAGAALSGNRPNRGVLLRRAFHRRVARDTDVR